MPDPLQAGQAAKDTFWDGNSFTRGYALDPAKYHDPAEEAALGTQSLATAIPTGTWGATGTIVRRSTPDGAPLGYDPDAVATCILVDPDIPGQGFTFDPTQIRKDQMAAAVAAADPQHAVSVEERRFRASNVLRQFAAGGVPEQPVPTFNNAKRESPINLPGTYVVPQATAGGGQEPMQPHVQTLADQGVQTAKATTRSRQQSPPNAAIGQPMGTNPAAPQQVSRPLSTAPVTIKAATLGGLAAQLPTQPPAQLPAQPVAQRPAQPDNPPAIPPAADSGPLGMPQPVQQPGAVSLFDAFTRGGSSPGAAPTAGNTVRPPTFKVTFEVKGVPFRQEAFYHQIVRSDATLVLAFDRRAVGFPKNFPLETDADLAVQIEGQDVIFVAKTTGMQFPFLDYDICILLIDKECPANQSPGDMSATPALPPTPAVPLMPS